LYSSWSEGVGPFRVGPFHSEACLANLGRIRWGDSRKLRSHVINDVKIAVWAAERRISQIKFAGKRIVVDNKNPCSQGIAPVAKAIPARLLCQGRKPKNLSATFSSLAASGLVLLEAVESRLVSRGKLCSLPSGSALAPPLERAPSRQ